MSNFIVREREGDITTITINRPEIGNRVSNPMASQLADMSRGGLSARADKSKFCTGG